MFKPRVAYVFSTDLIAQCDKIPVLRHRVRIFKNIYQLFPN